MIVLSDIRLWDANPHHTTTSGLIFRGHLYHGDIRKIPMSYTAIWTYLFHHIL